MLGPNLPKIGYCISKTEKNEHDRLFWHTRISLDTKIHLKQSILIV